MAKDTIITILIFGNAYLLDGKRLNIQVMQWFMTDHRWRMTRSGYPLSVDMTDGGGVYRWRNDFGAILVGQDDRAAGEDLMLMGASALAPDCFINYFRRHQRRCSNRTMRISNVTSILPQAWSGTLVSAGMV